MIEIEHPPDIRACAPCSKPLTWLWSARTQQWVPFHSDSESSRTLHVHECDVFGHPPPSWRTLAPQHPQAVRAGAARARQALAAKENPS